MTIISILSFLGGVMLFIYGISIVGEGLKKAAGERLRVFLRLIASNRFKALGTGFAMSSLMQSYSAASVLTLGFTSSGILGLTESLAVMLGAGVGTTITIQLIAIRVYDYALIIIGLGLALKYFGSSINKSFLSHLGHSLFGFGLVFLALDLLVKIFTPLAENSVYMEKMTTVSEYSLALLIASIIITILVQSSSVVISIVLGMAFSGSIMIHTAIPLIMGAAIGTASTAVIASIGSNHLAKRLAYAQISFYFISALILLPFTTELTTLLWKYADDNVKGIALFHATFNIFTALLFLPFLSYISKLSEKLIPDMPEKEKFTTKYLDQNALATPSVALDLAGREVMRAVEIVKAMMNQSIKVMENPELALIEKIEEADNDLDLLDREVKLYLAKLSKESLSEEEARRELMIFTFSDNLENIGDVIDKNIMELARKKALGGLRFSHKGMDEIKDFFDKVMSNFELSINTFLSSDSELAKRLLDHKVKIRETERSLREAHMDRLRKGLKETIDTSSIHLDLLTHLKRINSYLSNIAYIVVEMTPKSGEEKS